MMKIYQPPETKGWKTAYLVLFFLLLFLSRDTLTAMYLVGFARSQLLTALLLFAVGLAFLFCQRRHLKEILLDFRMGLALLASALLLIPMAVKQDFQTMYFSILFYILASILLSYVISLKDAARSYLLVLSFLSAYAVLCTYLLRIFPDQGILEVPVFRNAMDMEFYNFGLAQVSIGEVSMRNFGIFREPGVYQFFLLTGLYLNNYRADWEKTWVLWTINGILAATMVSTFATGGLLELGLLAVFLFFDKKWYKNKKARLAACALILLGIAAGVWTIVTKNSLYYELRYMLLKFTDDESGLTRYHAIAVDLDIFFHHPIFGDTIQNVLHSVEGNSTSTLILYACLGFLGGSFHVVSWGALVWDRDRGIFRNLFLLLILFMSFNTQNLTWNLMFWLFPMLGMGQRLPLPAEKQKTHASESW